MFTEQNSIAFKIVSWKFIIRIWKKKSSVLKIEVFQDTFSKYIIDFCVWERESVRVCVCVHIHTGPKQAIAS